MWGIHSVGTVSIPSLTAFTSRNVCVYVRRAAVLCDAVVRVVLGGVQAGVLVSVWGVRWCG